MKNMHDRLRKSFEYHIDEYAQRLLEIGGPGVGGTELAFRPHVTSPINTHNEYIMSALERSIWRIWEEAAWCYVDGKFSACIVMAAIVLEIALKYELFKRSGRPVKGTLVHLIKKANKAGIIPNDLISIANSINNRRNDIVHANIQTNRPESLLHHTGNEHGIEPIEDLSKIFVKDGWFTGDSETNEFPFKKKANLLPNI